jgi:hypothetical protein
MLKKVFLHKIPSGLNQNNRLIFYKHRFPSGIWDYLSCHENSILHFLKLLIMAHISKPLFIAFCILFSISSCTIQMPVSKGKAANNKDYEVAFLFEHDGCKVYRFEDGGQLIYFTSCNGETTRIQSDSTGTRRYKSINKSN